MFLRLRCRVILAHTRWFAPIKGTIHVVVWPKITKVVLHVLEVHHLDVVGPIIYVLGVEPDLTLLCKGLEYMTVVCQHKLGLVYHLLEELSRNTWEVLLHSINILVLKAECLTVWNRLDLKLALWKDRVTDFLVKAPLFFYAKEVYMVPYWVFTAEVLKDPGFLLTLLVLKGFFWVDDCIHSVVMPGYHKGRTALCHEVKAIYRVVFLVEELVLVDA